jgi:hypothetical protein
MCKTLKKKFLAVLIFSDMTNTVFQRLKLNISSISHQQANAEHWVFTNTEIFQSKDVASGQIIM